MQNLDFHIYLDQVKKKIIIILKVSKHVIEIKLIIQKKLKIIEERLRREREEIEKRQREENKRYRPKIDLPIQKIHEVEPIKKVKQKIPKVRYDVEEEENNVNIHSINENTLRYLKMREIQMNDYNDQILNQLNIKCLKINFIKKFILLNKI